MNQPSLESGQRWNKGTVILVQKCRSYKKGKKKWFVFFFLTSGDLHQIFWISPLTYVSLTPLHMLIWKHTDRKVKINVTFSPPNTSRSQYKDNMKNITNYDVRFHRARFLTPISIKWRGFEFSTVLLFKSARYDHILHQLTSFKKSNTH